jgi:hypothetical protein
MDYQTQEKVAFVVRHLGTMSDSSNVMRREMAAFHGSLKETRLPKHGETRRIAAAKAVQDFIKASEKLQIALDRVVEGLQQDLMEGRH